MARGIQLDHDTNTTLTGVLDDLRNVRLREALLVAVGTVLRKLRVRLRVERERNRVNNVPVHRVELRIRERVNDDLQRRDG